LHPGARGRTGRRRDSGTEAKGKKVAILATDGFEQSELVEPRRALDETPSQANWFQSTLGSQVSFDFSTSSQLSSRFA
jgi:hypothetical protein